MLGFEVAQSTVSNYMVRRRSPPSQSWKTFLRSHGEAIAAIDMCVVPTVTFELLFAFLVVGHGRRHLLWFEVTRRPTAEWLARQITEAFLWASAPTYLVRDNDRAYGLVFRRRARVMGIRDRPISPSSPWQNGIAERLIGTLRREGLDQMLVLAKRTYGEFSPPMRRITIRTAPIWRYRRTPLYIGPSSETGPLSPYPFCRVFIIGTRGYDFRKGQARGALGKPSLHETVGREFRLWRLVELAAAALPSNERIDGGSARANGKLGVCGPPGLLATDFVQLDSTRKSQRCAGWPMIGRGHQCSLPGIVQPCRRSKTTSACNAAGDRNSPITAHQINLR